MDKDVIYIHGGMLPSHLKEWNNAFAVTWMNLQIVLLKEVRQNDKYYMVSLVCGIFKKNDTNERIYKTDS